MSNKEQRLKKLGCVLKNTCPSSQSIANGPKRVIPLYIEEPSSIFERHRIIKSHLIFKNEIKNNYTNNYMDNVSELLFQNDKNYYISDGDATLKDIAYAISDTTHPVDIKVERNGKIVPLKTVYPNKKGQLGIQLETKEILAPTKSFPKAVVQSYKYLYANTYMMC